TFTTASGTVRVTDAMVLADESLVPMREVVRRIEGFDGRVPMRWRVEPGFDFGRARAKIENRGRRPFVSAGRDGFVLGAWDAGEPELSADAVAGRFDAEPGRVALLDLAATHQEPAVIPCRADIERRLERTQRFWPGWTREMRFDGPWRDEVA